MHNPETLDLERIPTPALLVRLDGSIARSNTLSAELLGYGPGELVGLEFGQLIHEEHREEWRQLLEAAFADQTAPSSGRLREIEGVANDDREITVDIEIGQATDGSCAVIIMRDVTEAGRMLAELRESERRLRLGVLHTTDLVQYVDIDNDSLDWYGDLDSFLGYEPGDFPRTISGWLELIHPDDVDRIQAEIDAALANQDEGWSFQYRLRAGDGSYRHLLDRGTVSGYSDGRPIEGIGGIIDETEHVFHMQELESALARVEGLKNRLEAESSYLQAEIAFDHGFDEIVGSGGALAAVLEHVNSVAETDATVLLLGETGTGKELLAHAIHRRSRRKDRPLIKVDCGTLPAGLIESELFGHEKGAFTGAHDQRIGRFELAHEGTIFLDEIGELPLDLQPKLLRVIEDGEFRRVGAKSDHKVDVRVIAATNRDLRLEVREGRFRSDLFYRISVFPIEAPPLRERRSDIPALVSFFVSRYAASLGKTVRRVAQPSLDALVAYDWPGNIRELRNLIERSVILCRGDTLTVDPLLLGAGDGRPTPETGGPLKRDLQAVERARVIHALEEANWKIKGEGNAASRLGVTPSGLRSRMKKLGITRPV
jgi:PAS domain S-box-containing protein